MSYNFEGASELPRSPFAAEHVTEESEATAPKTTLVPCAAADSVVTRAGAELARQGGLRIIEPAEMLSLARARKGDEGAKLVHDTLILADLDSDYITKHWRLLVELTRFGFTVVTFFDHRSGRQKYFELRNLCQGAPNATLFAKKVNGGPAPFQRVKEILASQAGVKLESPVVH